MSNQTNYNLSYDCRDEDTRSTIMSVNVSFENASDSEIKDKLNVWLKAIGTTLEVVEPGSKYQQQFLTETEK